MYGFLFKLLLAGAVVYGVACAFSPKRSNRTHYFESDDCNYDLEPSYSESDHYRGHCSHHGGISFTDDGRAI